MPGPATGSDVGRERLSGVFVHEEVKRKSSDPSGCVRLPGGGSPTPRECVQPIFGVHTPAGCCLSPDPQAGVTTVPAAPAGPHSLAPVTRKRQCRSRNVDSTCFSTSGCEMPNPSSFAAQKELACTVFQAPQPRSPCVRPEALR